MFASTFHIWKREDQQQHSNQQLKKERKKEERKKKEKKRKGKIMASLWSRVSDVFKSDEVDDFEDDDDDDGDNRDSDEAHGNNHKNNHSSNDDDNNDSDNQDSDTDGAEDDAESEEVGCPFPAQCVRMPPPCESWPDRPILLRVNDTQFEENRLSENYAAEDCGQGAFRINRIAKFESALCKGRMLVRIREEQHATEHSRNILRRGVVVFGHPQYRSSLRSAFDATIS